jgi:hypothetical protein
MSVKEKMTAIADTIRSHTGGTDKLFLDDMPNEIENACAAEYEKGFTAGQAGGGSGYEQGFADGKQAEYDRFWDVYQQNGNRTNYERAFAGVGWTKENFKPKYIIRPIGNMYMTFAYGNMGKIDESVVDTSKATSMSMAFYQCTNPLESYTNLTDITIDLSSLNTLSDTFNYNGALETLVLKNVPETCKFTGGFESCRNLTNLTITGTIGGDTVKLPHSTKLTKVSIESIVEHLSNTATGKSLTLSKKAVDAAFHDPEGEDVIGSASADWNSLMESKPNWTITLV